MNICIQKLFIFCPILCAVSTPTVSVQLFTGILLSGSKEPLVLNCTASLSDCENSGSYLYDFTWQRGDMNIVPSARMSINSNTTNGYSQLTILPLTRDDSNFNCTAKVRDSFSRLRSSTNGEASISLNVEGNISIIPWKLHYVCITI